MTKKSVSQRSTVSHPIVVAVDPMERKTRRTRQLFKAVASWQGRGQRIEPVSVISPLDLGWPIGVPTEVQRKLTQGVLERVQKHLEKVDIKTEPPQVLYAHGLSMTDSVHALVDWAAEENAEVIFAHAYTGDKLRISGLGSFSERLIGSTNINVVVLGHQSVVSDQVKRIVFSTDFSLSSSDAFDRVVEVARRWDAEIVLFHHLADTVAPFTVNAYGVTLDPAWVQQFMDAEAYESQAKGDQWVTRAIAKGARCRFVLDQGSGTLTNRIKTVVRRERADLLAVSIHRSATAQIFLGRAVRALFSQARCPVLVINSKMAT